MGQTVGIPPLPRTAITVGGRDFSFDEASSFYEEIRGKLQTLRSRSNPAIIVKKDDFKRLSSRLLSIVAPYTITRDSTKIFVDFTNDSGEVFNGILDFLQFDYSTPAKTAKINIDLGFLIKNNDQNSTSEFNIDIYIGSGVTFCQDEYEAGMNADRLPFVFSSVSYTINFQNYVLARNCAGAIDDWVKSLEHVEESALHRYLHDGRRVIATGMRLLSLLALTFLSITAVSKIKDFFMLDLMGQIGLVLAFIIFSDRISGMISERVQSSLRRLRGHSFIDLTSGDKSAFQWYQKHRNGSIFVVGALFIGTLAMNVLGKYLVSFVKVP